MNKQFHNFWIGTEIFSCSLESNYSDNGQSYWMPDDDSDFRIDHTKCFRTKEACETYMRKEVEKTCRYILKHLKENK